MHFYFYQNGEYEMQIGQAPKLKILPFAEHEFFVPSRPELSASFVADENGEISHAITRRSDQASRMKRYPAPPPAIELDSELLELYKGTYAHKRLAASNENSGESDLLVAVIRVDEDNRTLIDFDNQAALEIVPTSDTEFYIRGFDSHITMVVNPETGRVERMDMLQDGILMKFERQ